MKAGQAALRLKMSRANEDAKKGREFLADLEALTISLEAELEAAREERDKRKVCACACMVVV